MVRNKEPSNVFASLQTVFTLFYVIYALFMFDLSKKLFRVLYYGMSKWGLMRCIHINVAYDFSHNSIFGPKINKKKKKMYISYVKLGMLRRTNSSKLEQKMGALPTSLHPSNPLIKVS